MLAPNNSVIEVHNDGASMSLHCLPDFELAGNKETYCNGTDWDRPLGTCRPASTAIRTECDFETVDYCGWENDLENSYDWKRRNGFASFDRFVSGPIHDHTTGKPLMGHYMVAEASKRNSKVARLVSPIYKRAMSVNACFRIFSHMYGATVGNLTVYIKPEHLSIDVVGEDQRLEEFEFLMRSKQFKSARITFCRYLLLHKHGSSGNRWVEDFILVQEMVDDFQIVIEAKPVRGIISDIAVDDVALLSGHHCIQFVQNETTVATEEPNGVYNVMSCVNRCNETDSLHNATKFEMDMMTGKQVEVCDCHDECVDLETCCPDYVDNCLVYSSK